MKLCSYPDCVYPVFSKGLCNVHWKRQFGSAPSNISFKRQKQITKYVTRRKKYISDQKQKNRGKIFCGFCGNEILGRPDLHHTVGRDDETLLNEIWWHLAHIKCHFEYHNKSCNDISWWEKYKEWVKKNMNIEVSMHLQKKFEKREHKSS